MKNTIKSKFIKGFSIAEAMVTLLIVSMALAAMAPILSKKMKNDAIGAKSAIPTGAVMAFDLDSCPDGWIPLSTKYSDSEGAFIRNIGGNALSKGTVQLDAAPNLTFQFAMDDVMAAYNFGGNAGYKSGSTVSLHASSEWNGTVAIFDAKRASAAYGRDDTTEVRPKNIALLYCRKD